MPLVATLDLDSFAQALAEDALVTDLRESNVPAELTWDSSTAFTLTMPGLETTFKAAVDMKPRLLAHGKRTKPVMRGRGSRRHVVAWGYRYQIIPFGWRITGGGDRSHGPLGAGGMHTGRGTLRSKYIGADDLDESGLAYLKAHNLTAVDYTWANAAGEHMAGFADRRRGGKPYYAPGTGRPLMPHQGVTFRTVSEKSDPSSWWYPHKGWRLTEAAKTTLRWLGVR